MRPPERGNALSAMRTASSLSSGRAEPQTGTWCVVTTCLKPALMCAAEQACTKQSNTAAVVAGAEFCAPLRMSARESEQQLCTVLNTDVVARHSSLCGVNQMPTLAKS